MHCLPAGPKIPRDSSPYQLSDPVQAERPPRAPLGTPAIVRVWKMLRWTS